MWIAPMVGTNHEMLSNMDQWHAPMVCALTISCILANVHGACWYHPMGPPLLPMAPSSSLAHITWLHPKCPWHRANMNQLCAIDMWLPPMVGNNCEMLSNMDQWQAPVVCASTIPCSLAVVHGACWCHAMGSPLLPMAPLKLPWVHHLATCQVSMAWSS